MLSRNVRKRTFGHVRPVKIQISLRISAGWSEFSLGTFWIAIDAKFLYADNEASDKTAGVHRLIGIIISRTCSKAHSVVCISHLSQNDQYAMYNCGIANIARIICMYTKKY